MPQITELSPDVRLAESPRLLSIKRFSDEAGTWVCVLVKRAPHRKRSVLYRVRAWLAAWVAPKGIDTTSTGDTALVPMPAGSKQNCPVGRFIDAVRQEWLGLPAVPARSEDAYAAFMHWWTLEGLGAVPSMKFFMSRVAALGVRVERKRYLEHGESRGPHSIAHFGDPPPGESPTARYGQAVAMFRAAVADYKGRS